MTSVERINEYITLDHENLDKSLVKPSDSWPEHGEVRFDDVSFAYDTVLPNVLEKITFRIQPREKIGIIGRTGSGKSSIFQAMLLFAEPSGQIIIDGLNTKDISLHDLRNKISIIPVITKTLEKR
jgi:ABC-type multidrug transport system fused ATPase/permease subunit